MIYLTGDTHCGLDMGKLSTEQLKKQGIELTEKDHLIITGDFGFPFLPSDISEYEVSNGREGEYSYHIKYLRERPYTILFIEGNHDNHDWWSRQEVTDMFGGKVQIHPHATNVIHLMRGEMYMIEDRSFFTFGGAMSVDKPFRTEGVSWWSGEEASSEDMQHARDVLEKNAYKADYIITHTLPHSIIAETPLLSHKKSSCKTAGFLDEILERVTYDKWFCGHFHVDMTVPEHRINVLYNSIVSLKD